MEEFSVLSPPFYLLRRWQKCGTFAYVFTDHVRGRRKIGGSRKDRGPRGAGLSGRSENSLRPEGSGCCLALLSSAFNVTERNCQSDRDDRQLLTASGEKRRLVHCGVSVCHARHGGKCKSGFKKRNTERSMYGHLKFYFFIFFK